MKGKRDKVAEGLEKAVREARAKWNSLQESERQRITNDIRKKSELAQTWRLWVPGYGLKYADYAGHPFHGAPPVVVLYHIASLGAIGYALYEGVSRLF